MILEQRARRCTVLLCWCAQCIIHAPTRTAMRNKYGLKEAPCSDCCVTFLCASSAASDPTPLDQP